MSNPVQNSPSQSLSLCALSENRDLTNTRAWQHLQESDGLSRDEDLAKWESELNQLMTTQREELEHDYGGAMQHAWESGESGVGEFTDNMTNNTKFDELGYPILTEYVFGEPRFVFPRAHDD